MKLNLGCGPDVRAGFINLDVRKLPGVTVCDVTSVKSMEQYRGADFILARDILEHFSRAESHRTLKMWIGLLKKGGKIRIQCPELYHAVKIAYSDEWVERLLYGGQDYPENFHKTGYTKGILTKLLNQNGCSVTKVELTRSGNIVIDAVKK